MYFFYLFQTKSKKKSSDQKVLVSRLEDLQVCDDDIDEIESESSEDDEFITTELGVPIGEIIEENETEIGELGEFAENAIIVLEEDENIEQTVFIENIHEENFLPSAPAIENTGNATKQFEIISYPDLNKMRILEQENNIPKIIPKVLEIHLEPFNEDELKQFYENPELKLAEKFQDEFIEAELDSNVLVTHILYDLLAKYSKYRSSIKTIDFNLTSCIKECQSKQNASWEFKENTIRRKSKCGDNELLQSHQTYKVAELNELEVDNLLKELQKLLSLGFYDYTNNCFQYIAFKLQIEQKIREILTSCSTFVNITTNMPVSLNSGTDPSLKSSISELRTAISILFLFLRRPPPDKVFTQHVKEWLLKLVAVHLRIATWNDHLFLIYHTLRCPNNLGTWASSMIQIPFSIIPSDLNSPEIHHCITLLSILLLPIKKRNEFLIELNSNLTSSSAHDENWMLIDSDGEEGTTPSGDYCGIKESDLVSLLNQIPLENLFRSVTLVELRNENYTLNENDLTGHHMLKLISFSSTFVKILGEGLKTYDTEKYRQFAKRLARLVRHCVLYLTDVHEIFKKNIFTTDLHLLSRIQIEYSSFLLKTCCYIYKSRNLGTWQYLVDLPFIYLDIKIMWMLYYHLNVGFADDCLVNLSQNFKEKIIEKNFENKFNENNIDVPAEDLYYLLQTFSNMILSRHRNDWDFIKLATLHLFEIGYVNKITREICYKTTRDLLINITTKYPELISDLFIHFKSQISEVCFFFFVNFIYWSF